MMNYIWPIMIILSIMVGFSNGRIEQTGLASMSGAVSAVELLVQIGGVICLWNGIMKVAEKSGMVEAFSKAIAPILKLLFPALDPKSPAAGAISMNMAANVLGLGNAATPLGIKAMEELNRTNTQKGVATNEMIMLVVLNTASLQLVPSTLIALRAAKGSVNPAGVIVPIIISSFIALCFAVTIAKLCEKFFKVKT